MSTRTIDDILERLTLIGRSVPADDGVGRFNGVYLTVTQEIRDRLGTGFFADDVFMERLDVVFADRYLAAVDDDAAGQRPGKAWRPLFEHRDERHLHPVQFVLAGMNAHINHDLAVAVVEACAGAHTRPDDGSVAADYQLINQILAENDARVRAGLFGEREHDLARPLEPLIHLLGTWSIDQARDAAWIQAQVLWELRNLPLLFRRTVEVSAAATGMTGRHLLVPLLP